MTLPVVLAIAGCIALLVGLFGGGVKAKEIEVPKISSLPRILSSILGMFLIGISIWLSLPSYATTTPIPTATPTPSSSPIATPALPSTASLIKTELEFSGSRLNSGSIFGSSDNLTVFNTNTTKNDDFLWIGEYPEGAPSLAFVEIPLNDPVLLSGKVNLDQATLSIKAFRISEDPFHSLGPLLLFQYDYGVLDAGDAQSFWLGLRLGTFEDTNELREPVDLTQETRNVLKSGMPYLRLMFHFASELSEDKNTHLIRIKPEDIRLRLVVLLAP